MSDNEIEDVSFLPGENLHRKAVYEPDIIQKLRILVCNKTRLAVLSVITFLVLLVIALIAALSHQRCPSNQPALAVQQTPAHANVKQTYLDTNGHPFPYKNIRLPGTLVPLHYKLYMHPNISQSLFTGKVAIVCNVKQGTNFIVFHIKDLNITKLTVKVTETGNPYGVSYQEYKTNEQVYVKLDTSLTVGSNVTMEIAFRGQLISKLAGFYKSMYKTKSGEERYIATTHFEPTDARAAFPCFDEPQLKAIFDLTMVREKNQVALFNMPLVDSTEMKSGLVEDRFQPSVQMSTYLVAFIVSDYKNLTKQTKRKITVGVYAPEDMIHAGQFALDTAVKIIDHYEDFFGVNYPLPKQDLVAIPDFAAGAMENWGLITYRMTAILYDPEVASASNKQRVAVVIAHELAHQWFGNLVTMKWWDDLWLNEGFASFVEYIGSAIIEPEWHMSDQFVTDTLLNALYLDSLSNSHPINQPVENPNQINELFDTITYDKGASIIRMLSSYLGEGTFKQGLTAYLQKYTYSNAATSDLWNSLSKVSSGGQTNVHTDVAGVMKTWTEQMGYPVITLHRAGRKVTATQSHFLLYKHSNKSSEFTSPYDYKWQIPFTYTTSSDPSKVKKMLLKHSTESFMLDSATGWMKGNCGMNGYYRVNYDKDNWSRLIQQLNKKNHGDISVAERAGLIDDAFMLARAGLLPYSTALDLSQYMVNEDDYLPWRSLLDNLHYIEIRIAKTPAFANYKAYVLTLMKKQLDAVTWEDTGTLLQKYLRGSILGIALRLGHEKTIKKGLEEFDHWKVNHSSINANLKNVIYHAGVRYGNDQSWDTVWDAYTQETDASEQRKFLSALGSSREANLLSRFLNYAMDEKKVRPQDTDSVVEAVAGSSSGQILAWRFVQQNWELFMKRYGSSSFTLSSLIKAVTSRFDTDFDHQEVQNFFKSRDVGSGKRAVSQVLEKIQINADWLTKHKTEVTDWFLKYGKV